jgi:hypothetical protein
MELPMVAPAPVVTDDAGVFRDRFDNQCQCRHVPHSWTGRIVLPHKSLAHIARGLLESADQTQLSRFRSAAPWQEGEINRRRIRCMLQAPPSHRDRRRESLVVMDETLCEHVGSLCDDGDRHDNHRDGTFPLAHHPVPRVYVSAPVRFPRGLRLYRRDEELTPWDGAVAKHGPDLTIPTTTKARHRLPTQVDPVWRQEPEVRARHEPFQTTIALAIDLIEEAIRHQVPLGVVVFDTWDLAEDVVQIWARRRKDGVSLLKKNRGLETASVHLRDVNGWPLQLPRPHLAVEELVALIPANAYRPVSGREHLEGCFTRAVRIPGLGQVRIVVSFEHESLTGRSVVLGTNRVDWSAATIISLSLHRWPPDTFDQDRKGPLGCNEYRRRSTDAMGTHGGLVFVASSLLPLTCLPAAPGRTQGLSHTMGDACRAQARALLQKLWVCVHDQLSQGITGDHVFAQVFAKQQSIAPA